MPSIAGNMSLEYGTRVVHQPCTTLVPKHSAKSFGTMFCAKVLVPKLGSSFGTSASAKPFALFYPSAKTFLSKK